MNGFFASLQRFGLGRLAAFAGIGVGIAAALAALFMNMGSPNALLYSNLDLKEAGEITKALDQANIRYEAKVDGSTIMVARDEVASTRLLLSGKGLPTAGSVGYEIFDQSSVVGQTDFVQQLNRQRALEGELARTIQSLDGVSSARVHLVLPKKELFEDEIQQPSASVSIAVGAREPTPDQVRAIQNLVAGAVPNMKPDRVTVVDQHAKTLSGGAEGDAMAADGRKSAVEARIAKTVKTLVEGVVGPGKARVGALMAMDPRGGQVELPGEHMREPAFGLPATWIEEGLREEATFRGYTVVDPSTVLTTHLTEILKENMPDLLSYAEVQKLLRDLPAEQKKLVDDIVPSVVSVTTIQRVLQALLRERVSIRDLPAILEGLSEAAPHSASLTSLVEQVRARLSRQLSFAFRGEDGALPIITLSPEWENAFAESLVGSGEERQLSMAPSRLQEFIRGVGDAFERAAQAGDSAVLLTSPGIRPYVRSLVERFRGQTPVMSQNEVHPRARLKTVGMI